MPRRLAGSIGNVELQKEGANFVHACRAQNCPRQPAKNRQLLNFFNFGLQLQTSRAKPVFERHCNPFTQTISFAFLTSFLASFLASLFQSFFDPKSLNACHVWLHFCLLVVANFFAKFPFEFDRQVHHPVNKTEQLAYLLSIKASVEQSFHHADFSVFSRLLVPCSRRRLQMGQHHQAERVRRSFQRR